MRDLAPAPLTGTRPLACAQASLRQLEARLDALADTCTRRCERLIAALEHLPEATQFKPFPPSQGAPKRSDSVSTPEQALQSRRHTPAPLAQQPGAKANPPARVTDSTQKPPEVQRLFGTPKPHLVIQPEASGRGTSAPLTGADIARLPQAAGQLVAQLLAKVPAPLAAARGRQSPAPTGLTAKVGDAQFSRILGKLAAQRTGRPAVAQSAPARQASRAPSDFGGAVASALNELFAQYPEVAQPLSHPVLGSSLGSAMPGLLGQLLGGIGTSVDGLAPQRPAPSTPHRNPAPRASARLLDGAAAAQTPTRSQQASPASDAQAVEDGGELSRQLNRLLLDQAWLRGVDLT